MKFILCACGLLLIISCNFSRKLAPVTGFSLDATKILSGQKTAAGNLNFSTNEFEYTYFYDHDENSLAVINYQNGVLYLAERGSSFFYTNAFFTGIFYHKIIKDSIYCAARSGPALVFSVFNIKKQTTAVIGTLDLSEQNQKLADFFSDFRGSEEWKCRKNRKDSVVFLINNEAVIELPADSNRAPEFFLITNQAMSNAPFASCLLRQEDQCLVVYGDFTKDGISYTAVRYNYRSGETCELGKISAPDKAFFDCTADHLIFAEFNPENKISVFYFIPFSGSDKKIIREIPMAGLPVPYDFHYNTDLGAFTGIFADYPKMDFMVFRD